MNRPCIAIATLFVLFSSISALAGTLLDERYRKDVYMIPMRDGCKLYTAVYSPQDTSRDYPILMLRTPYGVGPYGGANYPTRLGPSAAFDSVGFIFVNQDVRGQYMSEGTFENMTPHRTRKATKHDIDESTDTYDTIDWLLNHVRHNNGRVGMWGISYPGFYVTAGSIDAHPALKAISPQAPIADWFIGDDVHHNGAFFLIDNFGFSSSFDRIHKHPTTVAPQGYAFHTPDAYSFFLNAGPAASMNQRYMAGEVPYWDSLTMHSTYDAFWTSHNILPHLKNMPPAVLVVGGWFDAEDLYGTLHSYESIRAMNPHSVVSFVMGPWAHGGWQWSDGQKLGEVEFGAKTAVYFRDSIEFPFFMHALKDSSYAFNPNRWMFETGSNQWRSYSQWPPANTDTFTVYLGPSQSLASVPMSGGSAFDEYVSDPLKPVPYYPGILNWRPTEYMDADQRFVASRPDVLVYETPPLRQAMTIVGPIHVHLAASTSGTDCDWVVKVIDAYPDSSTTTDDKSPEFHMTGYQMLVRGDIMPSRFRNSFVRPDPMIPGEPAVISFTMQDVNHRFLPGHRLMVQVQSSWFPLVDRNPQVFVPPHKAESTSMHRATQRVYHTDGHRSFIDFRVLHTSPESQYW